MDRNSIIGFVLIIAILIGFQLYTAKTPEELAREKQLTDSIAAAQIAEQGEKAKAVADSVRNAGDVVPTVTATLSATDTVPDSLQVNADSLRLVQQVKSFGIFHRSAEGTPEEIVLDNGKVQVSINSHGARPDVIRLKEYTTYKGKPLLLADPERNSYEYRFFISNIDLSTRDLFFTVEKKDSLMVRLKAATSDAGKWLAITYRLDSSGYFMHSEVELVGLEKEVDPGNLTFKWDLDGFNNEKYLPSEQQKSTVFFKYVNADRDYLSETEDDAQDLSGRINWVAFKQDFFTVAMVSEEGFASSGSKVGVKMLTDSIHNKSYSATLLFEKEPALQVLVPMRFYLGPNHYNTLRRTEIPQFDRIIDLGWGIFGWMNRFLVIPIFNFLSRFNLSYGIIILVLTIAIKVLLMPLTYRNQKSSARMRALKPEMEAINEKHKEGDPMKKQQAVMELYRKAGVNPAAGCVPMLIQLPVLYAMFRFFPSSIELRQQKFLWADDLSSYDSVLDLGFSIPMYGDHVSLFCLLMSISTIAYSLINQKQMPAQQGMPSMKLMIWLFPIMMLFFMNNFSSGLSYYYLLANVISILQMTVLSRWFIDEDKLRAELLANMKKPKKKSRWQQRLEDLQKEQQKRKR